MSFILTTGEPAGIGPDIVLQLFAKQPDLFTQQKITVICDKDLLHTRAKKLGITYDDHILSVIHTPTSTTAEPGIPNPKNADYVMRQLTLAAQGCLDGAYTGMITAPIHKGILNDGGFQIAGHTDFLTRFTKTQRSVMMLMTQQLKVALFTDHVPLRVVPDLLTTSAFEDCLDIIIQSLSAQFKIKQPRVLICGLNPHAGENGYLGHEEQDIMIPVIQKYRENGHRLIGPVAADIAFTPTQLAQTDIVLAMYHDQGLPTLKYSGFHQAINITLGLPFIRTSVDHGTAFDLAGTGKADTNSLHQAVLWANNLMGR